MKSEKAKMKTNTLKSKLQDFPIYKVSTSQCDSGATFANVTFETRGGTFRPLRAKLEELGATDISQGFSNVFTMFFGRNKP